MITVSVMTVAQMDQTLTDVARRAIQKNSSKPVRVAARRLRLDEWMALRSVTPKELAAAIETTEASISRWKNGHKTPRPADMEALESFFGVGVGGLYKSPKDADDRALLAGLSESKRQEVLNYIAFIRGKR